MRTYVDDHGRSFEPSEVETEWELERDENGNVSPLRDERGNLVADVDVSDEFSIAMRNLVTMYPTGGAQN
jgi:hypothetical protein